MTHHGPVTSTPALTPLPSSPAPADETARWWQHAVVYQVYPRSFADGNGDGVGDLPGITARLPYLADLGVDAIWISPYYVSPMADGGYDVADYRDVDPLFGSLGDAETLIAEAHALGLKVIADLVPNHTSDEHAWFRAALAAGPGSPERDRYLFRDGTGTDGSEPPNDWRSVFGGPAWSRVTEPDGTPGQWYLHMFDVKQPDLNWQNDEVHAEFRDVLRFWLDRGIDGFRVDVAHGMVKAEGLPHWDHEQELLEGENSDGERPPMWDQDGVHAIYREWREVLDEYGRPGDRMMVAEAWVEPASRLALYVRPDEMHQAFNFHYLGSLWAADDVREAIETSLQANALVGAPTTWVLSNHDVVRHASRLGLAKPGKHDHRGLGPRDPQPDAELGLRRARAASALMLALPGSAYLYQGEELGLPEHSMLADEHRQDPTWFRHGGEVVGRDGCRVPIPWRADAPAYGFSETGKSWLPQPASFARYAVDAQAGDPASTLELYRSLLALRKELGLGTGEVAVSEAYGADVLALVRSTPSGSYLVLTNFGPDPVALPDGAEVLLTSEVLLDGRVPTDVTVWARLGE
ncbi:glycoside hydrolase family 13 protein [Nocardioides sp.]|uniref:glycoside hydrolase family 13 protein n=1 Tax=Nocardioides sp. TaxID=35761 RepID=UPI0039C90448